MNRYFKSLASAAMLGMVAAACAPDAEDPDRAHVETAGSIQVVIDSEPAGDGMGGFGFGPGKVVTVAGTCLGVKIESLEFLVAWPAGSRVQGEDDEVIVTTPEETARSANGKKRVTLPSVEIRLGDTVHGGTPGYQGERPPRAKTFDWADDIDPACLELPVWQALEVGLGEIPRE